MGMITPITPCARGKSQAKKKAPEGAFICRFPATSERMLYAEREGLHVRAGSEAPVRAGAVGR